MCEVCASIPREGKPGASVVVVLSAGSSPAGHSEQVSLLYYVMTKQMGLGYRDYTVLKLPYKPKIRPCCIKAVEERLIALAPKVVVACGNDGYRACGGHGGIMEMRGVVCRLGKLDCWIYPTMSPAAVLRVPGQATKFTQDLRAALDMRDKDIQAADICPPVTYKVASTPEEAMRWTHDIDSLLYSAGSLPYVAVDIETGGGNGTNAWKDGYILALGFGLSPTEAVIIPERILADERVKECLCYLFETSTTRFIYQNGKFDVQYLRVHLGTDRVLCNEDTMLMHYALREEKGIHGLKEMARTYLGAGDYERTLKGYVQARKRPADWDEEDDGDDWGMYGENDYAKIPRYILHEYLAHDVAYTYRLYELLNPRLDKEDKRDVYRKLLMPVQAVLTDVEAAGLGIDRQYAVQKRGEYEYKVEDLLDRLRRTARKVFGWDRPIEYGKRGKELKRAEGYYEFNPNSVPQVQDILYNKLGYESPDPKKPKGTSRKILGILYKKYNHPFVGELLDFRIAVKVLGTYLVGVVDSADGQGRVHGRYNVHGTTTGRLSSAQPNMQNIPRSSRPEGKEVKDLFIPSPGCVFLQADYSQAEYRVAGVLSGDPFLFETYEQGGDLHSSMAIALFGPDYTKEQRTKCKTCNFLAMYGGGERTLADQLGISLGEAADILMDYWARMPVLQERINLWRQTARKYGKLKTPLGRTRSWAYHDYADKQYALEKEAGNFPIQSVASDMMLLSLVEIHDILSMSGHGRIVTTVHDSILLEVKPEHLAEVARMVHGIMTTVPFRYLGTKLPFEADFETGPRWGSLVEYKREQWQTQTQPQAA